MKNQVEIAERLNGIVSGKKLATGFAASDYLDKLFPKIADDPYLAADAIKDFFDAPPAINGDNISGFTALRDKLFSICTDTKWINSLILMAPHTHWEDRVPTIYQFDTDKDYYVIGPHEIEENEEYIPVSFVFSDMGPLPYEWAHKSINLDRKEWKIAFDLIAELNDLVWSENYPIGVSIDFRFKESIFEFGKSTVELPINEKDPAFEDFAYITRLEDHMEEVKQTNGEDNSVQVSWHPRSEKLYAFSSKEMDIMDSLRKELGAMNEEERMQYIKELEKSMG